MASFKERVEARRNKRLGIDATTTPSTDIDLDTNEVDPTTGTIDSLRIRNAIKATETGGDYTAKGTSGETGAYQFMPATWKQWSNEANEGKGVLDQTPENEEKVVEHRINKWIKQGLSVEEIAAKWNSGSHKGWEKKIGTNKHGAKFDVPAYVRKVKAAYDETDKIPGELSGAEKIRRARDKAMGKVDLDVNPAEELQAIRSEGLADKEAADKGSFIGTGWSDIPGNIWQAAKEGTGAYFRTARAWEEQEQEDYAEMDGEAAAAQIAKWRKQAHLGYNDIVAQLPYAIRKEHLAAVEAGGPELTADEKIDILMESKTKEAEIDLRDMMSGWVETMGEQSPIDSTGVAKHVDIMGRSMGYFLPTMFIGTVFGKNPAGKGATLASSYAQLMGPKYDQYIGEDVERKRAFNAANGAGITLGIVETGSDLMQIGRVLGRGKKAFQDIIPEAFWKKLLKNGTTEGMEELTQAHIEVIWDVYAHGEGKTVDEMADKVTDIWFSADFQKGAWMESLYGWGAGTVMTAAGGAAVKTVETVQKLTNPSKPTPGDGNQGDGSDGEDGGDHSKKTVEPGMHIVTPPKPKNASPDITDVTTEDGRPNVNHIFGVEEGIGEGKEDIGGVQEEAPGSGVALGDNLTTTPRQAAKQHTTNSSIDSVLEEMQLDQSMKQEQTSVRNNEAKLVTLQGLYDQALEPGIEDHDAALEIAEEYKKTVDDTAQKLTSFMKNKTRRLEKDKKLIKDGEVTAVASYVDETTRNAGDMVTSQIQAVKAREAQQEMDFEDTIREDNQALQDTIYKLETERGNLKAPEAKLYRGLGDIMQQKKVMTRPDFMEKKAKTDKLLDMKGDLRRKMDADAKDPKVSGTEKAVDRASMEWLDTTLAEKSEYDMATKDLEYAKVKEAEAKKAEAEKVKKSEQKRPLRRADKQAAVTKTKKEERRVAKKVSKTAERVAAVQKQKAQLRKKPATPVSEERKHEIEASKKRKADIKKQQAAVAEMDKGKPFKEETLKSDVAPEVKKKAQDTYKSAAIRFGGKVYEGNSHLDVITKNPKIEDALINMTPQEINHFIERGFVDKDGKFDDRFDASRKVGLKKGESLISENFLSDIAATRKGMKKSPEQRKATVRDALLKPTIMNKAAQAIRKLTNAPVQIVTGKEIDGMSLTQKNKDTLKAARGVFRASNGTIYINADQMAGMTEGQIQRTLAHESLHAAIEKNLRALSPDKYRVGMRKLSDWWDGLEGLIDPAILAKQDVRVKGFVKVMTDAQMDVIIEQQSLENGTGSKEELDKALAKFEEALTYPSTSPKVAQFLNKMDAPAEFKTSKIKTMWDWLVNHMLSLTGVRVRAGSSLAQLKEIADSILTMPEIDVEADARFSREGEDTSFDFGANVSHQKVVQWADQMDSAAPGAIKSTVVQTQAEAEVILGYKVNGPVPSVWIGEHKTKAQSVPGKKAKIPGKLIPEQVIFIAENIQSQDHFIEKWMHEQVGHHGLRKVFANNALFNRFLDQAYGLLLSKEQDLLNKIIELYDIGTVLDPNKGTRKLSKGQKREAAEEVIASKIQAMKPEVKKSVIGKFKTFLNKWLPKVFLDKKLSFRLKENQLEMILAAARETVLTGDNQFGEFMQKKLDDRAPRHPFQGWETLPAFMASDKTYKKWMKEVSDAAPHIRKWYEKHTETLKETFGTDADLFNILLAITSPQADVNTNVVFAVQTYGYIMGLTKKPGALFANKLKTRIDENWNTVPEMLADLESKQFKVTEFLRALSGDKEATVGDLWMYRAFFGDSAVYNKAVENYSQPQMVALRQKLHDLAAQMSQETGEVWTPREVQAAIWVYINAKQTGVEFTDIADYQSGFNKPSGRFDGKTPLQWLRNLIPNLIDAPLSQKLGLSKIPQAPMSQLAKQRLQQMSLEPAGKTKAVKTLDGAKKYVAAQKKSDFAEVLTISTPQKLLDEIKAGDRVVHISEDGQAGWSVDNNGDIQMVFSNSDKKGIGVRMVAEAIAAGGRTLDAYATLDKNGNEFLPNFYKNTFGFVETDRASFDPQYAKKGWENTALKARPDVVFMELGDQALNVFTDAKGVVKWNLVRDNLGGFKGSYTQTARFARDFTAGLSGIATESQAKADAAYLKTGNDGMALTTKIHDWRDKSGRNMDRLAENLEQELLEQIGGRKSRLHVRALGLGSGKLTNTWKTELAQKAMNMYIDSGTGANRHKAQSYMKKLGKKIKAKTATNIEKQQFLTLEKMLSLNEQEIAFADSVIRPYYADMLKFAKEHKLIDSQVDNYVKRMWNMPKELKDAQVSWSGGGMSGFTLTLDSGKQRKFDSIVDGWEKGMTLKSEGVIQNLQAYGNEMGYTFANRRFVTYLRSLIDFNADGWMVEIDPKKDPDFKPPAGYVRITDRGFAKPGNKLYAKKQLAEEINKLGERPTKAIWDKPIAKFIRKLNAMLKSTILSVTMFHHLAGMRSYAFGVSGKGFKLNPVTAYKRGLTKLAEQNDTLTGGKKGFKYGDYSNIGSVVSFLAENGLTIGKTQDWDESVIQDSMLEGFLEKRTSRISQVLHNRWKAARRTKRNLVTGLFSRLFAGLKAEAASLELVHKIKQKEKKLGRALTPGELKLTAQQTATLVNADFGGLHLSRMGRNPDYQRLAQLTMLAPDWTESNWRTATGSIPGVNKAINHVIGDNAELPGMGKTYRRFWGGIMFRALMGVFLSNVAIQALFGDEEDHEEYFDMLDEQLTVKNFHKGRWLATDLTPVAKHLPGADPEKRTLFSITGHFKDILKLGDPRSLVKHKVSPAARIAETLWSGTDWKGERFSTVQELWETGKFTAEGGKYAEDISALGTYATVLSTIGYNVRQSFPIPASEAVAAWQGETSWLSAIARGGGLDVRDVKKEPVAQQEFEAKAKEVNELQNDLDDARAAKSQPLIIEAQREIAKYDGFNRTKARIGATKKQISAQNRRVKDLVAKQKLDIELTPDEEEELREVHDKKQAIYQRAIEILER